MFAEGWLEEFKGSSAGVYLLTLNEPNSEEGQELRFSVSVSTTLGKPRKVGQK